MPQETWRRTATFGKYKGEKTWYQIALSDPGYVIWMKQRLQNDPEWASMARFLDRLVQAMDALPLAETARCIECGQPATYISIAGNDRVGYSVSANFIYCATCTDTVRAHNAQLFPIALRTAGRFRHVTDRNQILRVLKVLLGLPDRITARAAWQCFEPTPLSTTPRELVAISR